MSLAQALTVLAGFWFAYEKCEGQYSVLLGVPVFVCFVEADTEMRIVAGKGRGGFFASHMTLSSVQFSPSGSVR